MIGACAYVGLRSAPGPLRPKLPEPPPLTSHKLAETRARAHVLMSLSVPIAGRNLSLGPALHLVKAYASPAVALSLRALPRLAKFVAYLLIILNARSLPFAWHSTLLHYPILLTLISLCSSQLVLARRQDKMACMACPPWHPFPLLCRSRSRSAQVSRRPLPRRTESARLDHSD